jgi:hypothetical protein
MLLLLVDERVFLHQRSIHILEPHDGKFNCGVSLGRLRVYDDQSESIADNCRFDRYCFQNGVVGILILFEFWLQSPQHKICVHTHARPTHTCYRYAGDTHYIMPTLLMPDKGSFHDFPRFSAFAGLSL